MIFALCSNIRKNILTFILIIYLYSHFYIFWSHNLLSNHNKIRMSKKKSKKQTTRKIIKTSTAKASVAIEKGKKSAPAKKKLHPGSK